MGVPGVCGRKYNKRDPMAEDGALLRFREHEGLPWLQLNKPLHFSGPSSSHLESDSKPIWLEGKMKVSPKEQNAK